MSLNIRFVKYLNYFIKIYNQLYSNQKAREYEDVKIIRPTHSIFYINADYFRRKINEICPLKEGIKVLTICENVGASFINQIKYFKLISNCALSAKQTTHAALHVVN